MALTVVSAGHVRADVFVRVTNESQLYEGCVVMVGYKYGDFPYWIMLERDGSLTRTLDDKSETEIKDPLSVNCFILEKTEKTNVYQFRNRSWTTTYLSQKAEGQTYKTWQIIKETNTLFTLSNGSYIYSINGMTCFAIFKRVSTAQFVPGDFSFLNNGDNTIVADADETVVAPDCYFYNPSSAAWCRFLGWSKDKNAPTATFPAGTRFFCKSDATYYAIYQINESYMPDQCLDFTDIYAPNVECYYWDSAWVQPTLGPWPKKGIITGNPTNPYAHVNINVIESNALEPLNRPNASPNLYGASISAVTQTPSLSDKSIRLGDYFAGWRGAKIIYKFKVDTNENPIFTLHLAPMLEEPKHTDGTELNVYLYDPTNPAQYVVSEHEDGTYGVPLNHACSYVNASIGNNLVSYFPGNPKWIETDLPIYDMYGNIASHVYSINWAAVGFDLSPYHGKTMWLQIQVADCRLGEHLALCYYTTKCQPKIIESKYCGGLTLTAPEGFFYRWYSASDTSTVLSTNRNYQIWPIRKLESAYFCECSTSSDFECSFKIHTDISQWDIPQPDSIEEHLLCQGETYKWNGKTYNVDGEYYTELPYISATGCYPLVLHRYHYLPIDTTCVEATICANQTYEWGGQTYNQEGTYMQHYMNVHDCDSVAILRLSFYPPIDTTWTEATICAGESYVWEGNTYPNEGTYMKNYTRLDGCDSVAALQLHVKETDYGNPVFWNDPFMLKVEHDTICEGDAKWWHGKWIEERGFFTDTVQSVYGCDSVTYLQLEWKNCPPDPCTIQPTILPVRWKK
ncbi:MAG: hypothetical protein KBT27_06245 [Prevotellaceae bacterium]|nr:hypothetical protein [Candidatus Faecinaster equi]